MGCPFFFLPRSTKPPLQRDGFITGGVGTMQLSIIVPIFRSVVTTRCSFLLFRRTSAENRVPTPSYLRIRDHALRRVRVDPGERYGNGNKKASNSRAERLKAWLDLFSIWNLLMKKAIVPEIGGSAFENHKAPKVPRRYPQGTHVVLSSCVPERRAKPLWAISCPFTCSIHIMSCVTNTEKGERKHSINL